MTTRITNSQPSAEPSGHTGPDFSVTVPRHGYHWWYVDAFSPDHAYGLTIIAFIGSVFSPYYAWSRAWGVGDPYQHCSINVSLYGKGGKKWCMTERTQRAVQQTKTKFQVGPSSLEWRDGQLIIDVNEWTVPVPGRLRGQVRLKPRALTNAQVHLTDDGAHSWWPIAPIADVEVNFSQPNRHWTGSGYFDSNWGSEPLETGFKYWDWSRADLSGDRAAVLYDLTRRNGERFSLARMFDANGNVTDFPAPDAQPLPKNLWRVARSTQADHGRAPRVRSTLEDAPFYARSMIETTLCGERVTAMHESLDLDRFASRWVQVLLPFKMPRKRT